MQDLLPFNSSNINGFALQYKRTILQSEFNRLSIGLQAQRLETQIQITTPIDFFDSYVLTSEIILASIGIDLSNRFIYQRKNVGYFLDLEASFLHNNILEQYSKLHEVGYEGWGLPEGVPLENEIETNNLTFNGSMSVGAEFYKFKKIVPSLKYGIFINANPLFKEEIYFSGVPALPSIKFYGYYIALGVSF